jgi:CpXC protein
MGSRVYAGRTASTRTERVVYACPCGERFAAEVWRGVDARDQSEAQRLIDGSLNRVRCPSCEARAEVQVPVVFHDGAAGRLVLVLPDGLRHRELAERAALFAALAADGEAAPDYVLEPAVVFGAAGLRALLAPPPSQAAFETPSDPAATAVVVVRSDAARTDELPRLPAEEIAPAPPTPPAPAPAPPVDKHPSLAVLPSLREEDTPAPRRPSGDSDQVTRVHMAVPDPRSAVTERWIAGREGPAAFLV